jgi:small subunit ribosomal protein S1
MDEQLISLQQGQSRFSTLVEEEYDYSRPRPGEIRRATILSVGENDVLVDLGSKRDGIVHPRDLELLDDAYRAGLQVGDRVPVCVLGISGHQGELVVSLNQGLAQQDWLQAQELLESRQVYEAEAVNVNRGGVVVQFGRLRGFVPNSQLSAVRPGLRGERLWQVKHDLIGQILSLVVIEVDQQRRRLVLSQRGADWHKRQQLLNELTEGEVRTGVVRNLVGFGAFVDLGGLDGLIHISELDWQHVSHPSEVLSVGDPVEVYVLNVDRERERVGLSRKRLLPDPWPIVVDRLHVGGTVEGTVTGTVTFGVFVDLGEGVEGLVHNSQMPYGGSASSELAPGSPIKVRVLEVDRRRRRIALGLCDAANTAAFSGEGQALPLPTRMEPAPPEAVKTLKENNER